MGFPVEDPPMARKRRKKNKTAAGAEPVPEPVAEDPIQWTPEIDEESEFYEEETPEERLLSRKDFRKAAFTFFLAVLMFAACIIVWLYRDRFDPERLILSAENAVAKEEYVFDGGAGQVFAAAGRGLASATSSGLMLMDENGTITVSHLFQMATPTIAACSDFAVYYDLGGTNITVASFDGSIHDLTPEGNITSVTVSSGGYISITTDCTGYRGLVTVYDPTLEPVYQWYSSSAWVLSGTVSPDGKELAVLCYTASGSEVRFFNLTRTDQLAAFSVSDTVLLDVHWFSPTQLCAYSTEQAFFFSNKGQWTNAYSYENRYLTTCAFESENYAVFALSTYRSATASTLVSLDASGRVLGTADIQGEIISLTTAGSEVLVLCPDSALLYSSSLSLKSGISGLTGFKYGLLCSRGEALLISANFADRYPF